MAAKQKRRRKKYDVYGTVVGSKYLGEFEATSQKEAIDLALAENGVVELCHQCDSECEDAGITECTAVELKGEQT